MRRAWRSILLVVGSLVAVYLCGVFLFWNRFTSGTTVNDRSVALLSPKEAALNQIRDTSQTMLIFLRRGGSTESFTYRELGVFCPSDAEIATLSVSGWTWPVRLFAKTVYTFDRTLDYDYETLSQVLLSSDSVTSPYLVEPSDVSVTREADGTFSLAPAQEGNVLNTEQLLRVVCDALASHQKTIDLDASGCYVSAEIPEDFPDVSLPGAFSGTFLPITVSLGAGRSEVLDETLLSGMVVEQDGQWVLRYTVLASYVEQLAESYDTAGHTRTFLTSDQKLLSIVPKDTDTYVGWELYQEQTVAAIGSAILNQETEVSAVWKNTGKTHDPEWDLGNTYVELSLDAQHLWYYQDGSCVFETDVITGLPTAERATPTGLFRTLDFYEDYTMQDYWGSAYVEHFVRLTPNGVGIHDASWHSEFGGTIYQIDGSHGCINVPPEVMPELYMLLSEQLPQSVPVVIY